MTKIFERTSPRKTIGKIKMPYVLAAIVLIIALIFILYIPSILGSSHEGEKDKAEEKLHVLQKIKNELSLDLNESEVKSILGDKYTEVTTKSDVVWRFDFGAQEEYSYSDSNASADLDGILNGDLDVQLFVSIDDGEVEAISAVYLTEEDNDLLEYKILPDGEIQEKPIFLSDKELFYLSPPNMKLIVHGMDQVIPAELGTYTWTRKAGGVDQTVHVDAGSPIEIADYIEAVPVSNGLTVAVEFADSSTPELEGHYWDRDEETSWFVGKRVDKVVIEDGIIELPTEPGQYVMEIKATWEYGNGCYTIHFEVMED